MTLLAAVGEELIGVEPTEVLPRPDVRNSLAKYFQDGDALEFFDGIVQGYIESLATSIARIGHIQNSEQVSQISR